MEKKAWSQAQVADDSLSRLCAAHPASGVVSGPPALGTADQKKKKKKTQILSSPGGIKCDAIESEWPVTEGRQEKLMSPGGARIRGSSHPEMIH